GYVLFEIPSNLILFKVRPSIWIPSTMVAWGITMTLMALVKSFYSLMVARFILGVFEAGLVPGVVYYITLWYKRYEQSFRMGIILSGAPIAGAFSGLLTYAIVSINGENSILKGWQLVFTILVAIVSYFIIADYPEEAKWLSKEEQELAVSRLKKDVGDIDDIKIREHSFEKVYIIECLKDWELILQFIHLHFIFLQSSMDSVSMKAGNKKYLFISQLLVAPPFLVGGITAIIVSSISDRMKFRGPFLIALSSIGIVGYIAVLYSAERNVGIAMMLSIGNAGGIIAAQIYRSVDYPHYVPGHIIASSFLLMSICLSIIQYGTLIRLNELKKKERIKIKSLGDEKISDEWKLGDRHYGFIYSL
ncbi:8246_t:CDS:2, partial [Scutellospora calospora]